MLVLSRRIGEAVRIGSRLRVRVVSVSGGRVRLAIEAPDDVPIYREEVYARIASLNRLAADAEVDELAVLDAAAGNP